jgi:hypothetical protein
LVGGAANAEKFFRLFDKVFAFDVKDAELKRRLQNREPERTIDPDRWLDKNPEIHRVLEWNNKFKSSYKKQGVVFIDGSLSPVRVASKIISKISHDD